MSTILSTYHRKPYDSITVLSPSLPSPRPKLYGFTIVELLIVIIVIAILAAITIVAYNGVQQRANNTAIIDAANKSLTMIESYIAVNGAYPVASAIACITSMSGCQVNGSIVGANTTFDSAIATIGTLPRSIPMTSSTNQSGIWYNHYPARTYNGNTQPALLVYWLYNTGQSCGLSDVVSDWTVGVSSSTGYTNANDQGKTLCYIHISGPAA